MPNLLRRTFLQSLLGLLGLSATRPVIKVESKSYYFDWTCRGNVWEPYTDHPDYQGKLTSGPHNHVLCDGVEIMKVRRHQTGRDGWVEVHKRNLDGSFVFTPDGGDIEVLRYSGYVTFFTDDRKELPSEDRINTQESWDRLNVLKAKAFWKGMFPGFSTEVSDA